MENPYLKKVIQLEKQIGLFRDAVAFAVGSIEGSLHSNEIGLATDEQTMQRIKETIDKLWARKCELFDAVEVEHV